MKILSFALALLFSLGCSSLGGVSPNRLVTEKTGVRNTLNQEYLGSQRTHRFAPIVTERLIIQGNAIDGIVAYDRETLMTRWRLNIQNGVEGGAQLVGRDLYFGASDGFFYSVNAETGQVQWTYPLRAEGLSAPTVHNGVVYFISGANVAHAIEASSGKLLWVYTRRDMTNLSIRGGSQPAVEGDYVYVGFSDGFLVALKKDNGTVKWESAINRNRRFRDVDAQPVIDGERIFIPSYDGALYCVNKSDGKVIWSLDEGGESGVLLVGPRLYFSASSGKTLAVDKASGKVLWNVINRTGIATKPLYYKDMIIIGEMRGPLRFFDASSGADLGEYDTGWGITSSAVSDEKKSKIYFMTAGANLYEMKVAWKKSTFRWPWE